MRSFSRDAGSNCLQAQERIVLEEQRVKEVQEEKEMAAKQREIDMNLELEKMVSPT